MLTLYLVMCKVKEYIPDLRFYGVEASAGSLSGTTSQLFEGCVFKFSLLSIARRVERPKGWTDYRLRRGCCFPDVQRFGITFIQHSGLNCGIGPGGRFIYLLGAYCLQVGVCA